MTERGLIVQHHPEGAPARFIDWLDDRGLGYETVRVWTGEEVPSDLVRRPWVTVLGSWHSASDSEPAWIEEEIRLLGGAARADVPVLGICFGGQALAVALGGRISAALPVSIGWRPVESSDPALIPAGPWFHYNYEVFSTPPGALLLAHSASGPAAFTYRRSLGLQFHPEVTSELIDRWSSADRDHLEALGIEPETLTAARPAGDGEPSSFHLFDAWRERFLR